MSAGEQAQSGREPWRIVYLLAVTQIISYGSLFYAFALLASAIQQELGWRNEIVFGAFSWSLLVSLLTFVAAVKTRTHIIGQSL